MQISDDDAHTCAFTKLLRWIAGGRHLAEHGKWEKCGKNRQF